MGHKQKPPPVGDQLAETLIEAKATLTALREVLKDTRAAAREIDATLDRSDAAIAGQISTAMCKRVEAIEEMLNRKAGTIEASLNAKGHQVAHALEQSQETALQRIEHNYLELWEYIAVNAFGIGSDGERAIELINIVRAVAEYVGLRPDGVKIDRQEVDAVIHRLVMAAPCTDPTCVEHGTPPHASVQDKQQPVV